MEDFNARFAREIAELAAQVDPTEAVEWLSATERPPFCGALIGMGTGCRFCKAPACEWENFRDMDGI